MGKKEMTLVGLMILFILSSTPAVEKEVDLTKIVVVGLEFRGGSLHQRYIDVAYNYPPDYKIPPTEGLTIEIRSKENRLLKNFIHPDPRWVIISDAGLRYRENVSFDLILPFVNGMDLVEILDQNKNRLISINSTEEIRSFCAERNGICDPDCADLDPDCLTTVRATTLPTTVPTTLAATLPTTVPTTTLRPEQKDDLSGYLPYLAGVIVLAIIAFIVLRSNRLRRMEQKKKEEKDNLRKWTEEQLRNGEDPELLNKAISAQGTDAANLDSVLGRR